MSVIEAPGPHTGPSEAAARHVSREQLRLLEVFEKSATRAVQLLLLWNGGGSIAVLSYIGAVPEVRADLRVLLGLASFLVGLTLVGLAVAAEFTSSSTRYDSFNNAAGRYFHRHIGWDELWEKADPPTWLRVAAFVCGYLSLVFAIIGSGIGAWAVIKRAAESALT